MIQATHEPSPIYSHRGKEAYRCLSLVTGPSHIKTSYISIHLQLWNKAPFSCHSLSRLPIRIPSEDYFLEDTEQPEEIPKQRVHQGEHR